MIDDEPGHEALLVQASPYTMFDQPFVAHKYTLAERLEHGIHPYFEAQAERTPDTVALLFEEQHLTYGALNQLANQLAHYLRASGVGPEALVGLCLERSSAMILALLAILKAGGAYVPLDPQYPRERLNFMLQDAQITVLLTQQELLPKLPAYQGMIVSIDSYWQRVTSYETTSPESGVNGNHLAYVIYTSGSTGQPKGVLVEHKQLLNYTFAIIEQLAIAPGSSFAMVQPLTVDSCITAIFPPLCTGGCLHIIAPALATDAYALSMYFRNHSIDCLKIAPSHLAALHTSSYGEHIMPRQRLIIGGEASRWNWVSRLHALAPDCTIFNHYGPTETTVGVLTYRVEPGQEALDYPSTPLGRPIVNTQVYLLDIHLQPVSPGTAGELYIGGANLARGYLNRPELVAERFIPHPFSDVPGMRLYKTGDLARMLPDGAIEFLGRIDDQVKIRGFRIELQEIEAVLSQHPQVREAIVLSREDIPGNIRLVAYVVPPQQPGPSDSELRSFLSKRLPDYMLPAAFVTLDELPRTPHGKVDRRALPVPSTTRPALEQAYVAPETPLERFLAQMWQEMLGIDAIGTHDTFFELGGDSIKGAIFINKLQEHLGEIVYIVALFDAPTIASFAQYLNTHYRAGVARLPGTMLPEIQSYEKTSRSARIDAQKVAQLRQLITHLPPRESKDGSPATKNPPAIFVLAPPRSGTTLLRVMLGRHPALFAPPEPGLLSFNTLAERKAAFSGRDSFRLEGTIRAMMEIKGCDAEEARAIMDAYEAQQLTTQQFYRLLQQWIGEKILVDKTPPYALDEETLKRAELDFEQARYIHLIRHPYGMIRSFEEAKLDRIFFWQQHAFSARELAELVWLICHQNILAFLQNVPAERQHRVYFEELVKQPRPVIEEMCRFLGLEFHQDMLRPYKQHGMTDGIYGVSRMMGDARFHEHSTIDARVADRWQEDHGEDFLGEITWQVAESLGYDRPATTSASSQHTSAFQTTITAIQPVSRGAYRDFPLSFPQLRLWFLDQWEPANPSYNMHQALQLTGPLRSDILEQSFNEIIRRHEALRTIFVSQEGRPAQVVIPSLYLPLTKVDLTTLPVEQRETQARQWMTREILQPFDLARGPLLRLSLLRLDQEEHMLLLTKHHIISDAWSTTVLFRELALLYAAFSHGKPSPLPALSLQYPDFALWQRQWLQGEVFAYHLNYWKQQLAGARNILALPADHPRPPIQTYEGARHTFVVPQTLTALLKQLSRGEGVTLYITLLAAFQILLFRYTGQESFLIGTPIANRTRAEIEDLIGFFINTLVMRADLSGNPDFRELLARVRKTAVGAYAHQDLPFEQLVEALSPQRDISRSPLYQVVFSLQNAPQTVYELPGLQIRPLVLQRQTAKVDLALTLQESVHGLHGWWEYNVDLFDASTISRMHGQFMTILHSIVAQTQQSILTIPLLTAEERQQILYEWNPPDTASSPAVCIHTLFESQVERTPDALALICDASQFTYRQLNWRANQLAHHLQQFGVGPEARVGIYLPRSLDMVIALLAVLKAGGAYVPLDPAYPSERLSYPLDDAQVTTLITHQQLCEDLPAYSGATLALDTDQAILARYPTTNPSSGVQAENLAYVIYTSGSTGKPKGVLIQHRALVERTLASIAIYGLDANHRQSQFVSPAFDVLGEEIFPTLSCGALLVVEPRVIAYAPAHLLSEYGRLGVSKINLPASYWHQAIDELSLLEQPLPASLRLSVTGAESPSLDKLKQWVRLAQHPFRFFNVYGPTEATILATYHEVPLNALPEMQGTKIPIGRPLPATQIYLLDAQMQPVPIGVQGELYIGGAGLARGYLHQPDITAERFVPHPFVGTRFIVSDQSVPGARLYRTGDLARYLSDGTIEFLGRLDQQVKIRGFRIEPGEIEAVLNQHDEIQEAAVVAREDIPGDIRLVAYVVAKPQRALTVSTLRNYLQQRLPDYMVPSAVVFLEALPLTSNNKLDRQALPPPDGIIAASGTTYIAPRNTTEETLATIWTQVIGLKQVGIFDNFFEVGGHSLLATQVVARIRSTFRVELPLRTLFEGPTIAQLGTAILSRLAEQENSDLLAQMLAELEQLPENATHDLLASTRKIIEGESH